MTVKSVYIPEQEEQYSAIAREAQILIKKYLYERSIT